MTVESRTIGRFHTSYRLTPAALDARARLDALREPVLDAALDEALARAGARPDEVICVRSAAGAARLRLAASDAELVRAWSASLGAALAAAIAAGEPHAVRYRSRRQALVDVAAATAAGDLRRAWAWRQLGLWPDEEAVDGATAAARLADALAAEPRSVVPVLVAVARRGALPRLAVLLTAAGWQRLARAALAAAGLGGELLAEPLLVEPPAGSAAGGVVRAGHRAPAAARARLLLSGSALATATVGSGAAAGLAPASLRALAVLAALEADPGSLAGADTAAAGALLAALAAELDVARGEPRRRGPERRGAAEGSRAPGEAEVDALSARDPGSSGPGRAREAAAETGPAADEAGGVPATRVAAWTEAGGLLFLLPFAASLEPLEARTLRWTLHRLALVLLPGLDEADPAALAFAGLGPDELPPSDGVDAPADTELSALGGVARRIELELAERLDREPEPGLVRAVCATRPRRAPRGARPRPGLAALARSRREVRLWLRASPPPSRPSAGASPRCSGRSQVSPPSRSTSSTGSPERRRRIRASRCGDSPTGCVFPRSRST
jgi:hypothetical protein